MLSIADIDLNDLVLARNDGHPESTWWFDPVDGGCLYFGPEDDTDRPVLRARTDLVLIDHEPQPASDAEDFLVDLDAIDPALAAELARTLRGRRGWRRFRDAVDRSPAGPDWQRFAVGRERERAVSWAVRRGLVRPVDQ